DRRLHEDRRRGHADAPAGRALRRLHAAVRVPRRGRAGAAQEPRARDRGEAMTAMHVFALLGVAVGLYVLTAGADFGGGVWDLLAGGPRRERQRELIADAIAPIWEVNHIWMIFVVVMLFSVFPDGFAVVTTALHIPIVLALVGIVLRGS